MKWILRKRKSHEDFVISKSHTLKHDRGCLTWLHVAKEVADQILISHGDGRFVGEATCQDVVLQMAQMAMNESLWVMRKLSLSRYVCRNGNS